MNLYNIDNLEIPFDPKWKKIGLGLSGGADSALLCYLLCNLIKNKKLVDFQVHCLSHTRMWKTRPWQSWDSLRVFEWLSVKFPEITFIRHTNFIAPELEYGKIGPTLIDEYGKYVSGDNIQQRAFAEFICHREKLDAYYNGVTRNPRDIDLGGMIERSIDLTKDNQHLLKMQHMGLWVFHPFRFTDKSWVVRQYKKLDIQELFDITRSCEGEFGYIDYRTYIPNQEIPICGTCFWCKEREWAVEQNQ